MHAYCYAGLGAAQTDAQTAYVDDLSDFITSGPMAALPALKEELARKLQKPWTQIGVLAAMENDLAILRGIVERVRSGIIPPDPPLPQRYPQVPVVKENILANFQKAIALNDAVVDQPPGHPPVVDDRPARTPSSGPVMAASKAEGSALPLMLVAGGIGLFIWMGA